MSDALEPDEDGRLYPTYDVVIRRASDGVERVFHMRHPWALGSWFWWHEGNASCDCNREMDFERAGGMPEPTVRALTLKCGDDRYRVIRFNFPDGTSLDGPDTKSP